MFGDQQSKSRMRILIIEDEVLQASILRDKLIDTYPDVEVVGILQSVASAVDHLKTQDAPDLILMDILLPDGSSFDIFDQVEIHTPVIFTTAYDQYTLQAFKVHSVDYLLKPINEDELRKAIEKHLALQDRKKEFDNRMIEQLLRKLQKPTYKERFMVRNGQQINFVRSQDVLYAYAYEGSAMLVTADGKKHIIDNGLEELQGMLDPVSFFRVNRKYLVRISAIDKIYTWFNSRLKLELTHGGDHEVIVSRDRVTDFKQWLDQ